MGPMIDKANVTRVDRVVEAALAYATPIVRGGPVTDGPLAAGAFYRPTLLEVDDVNTDWSGTPGRRIRGGGDVPFKTAAIGH